MRYTHILLLALVAVIATTYGAPVAESEEVLSDPTTVSPVDQSDDVQDSTDAPEEVTTILPAADDAEDGSNREGRQVDEGDDEEEGDQDDEEDDDDEDEDADEEEEEEEDRKRAGAKPIKSSKKKVPAPPKPVPVLDQGVEDDEAEDLGIFERDEPKSSDEQAADKGSDEDADDEEKDDDDEEGSDEDDDEDDRDEPSRSTGLIAEPVSSERGDVDDVIPPIAPVKNDIGQPEQPLAIAVVQPEETADPVVPILVEETVASGSSNLETKEEKKNKKASKPEPQADDDEDDDEEEDEEEDDDSGRSEKVHRARSYPTSPVLYYYPFPDAPIVPAEH